MVTDATVNKMTYKCGDECFGLPAPSFQRIVPRERGPPARVI